MGLVARLSKRFVFDQKQGSDPAGKGFVSFISSISVAGLTLGVTTLLVVTSVINGFEKELKSALTAFHGHILLFSQSEPIEDPVSFAKKIKSEFKDVVAVSPYFFIEAMLSSASGVSGTVIEGVHLPTLNEVSAIQHKVIDGRLPESGAEISIGYEIARKLKVKAGDTVVLTIPFANAKSDPNETQTNIPLVQKLKVVGILKLGMFEYDNKYSVIDLNEMQKILNKPNRANAFKIATKDPAKSIETTHAMNDQYVYPLRARDWSSLNLSLFKAIQHEKIVITIIMAAIVLVASFNIISTLMMMVHDKKRQISMLKAMGMNQKSSLMIFLFIGAVMSVLGVLLGLGFAGAICKTLEWKSIIDIPPDIYGLSRLPVEYRPIEWIFLCTFVVVLALLSTLWPSIKVSKELPAEGLRTD